MNKKNKRRVFFFFLIYLPIQYLAIGIVGYHWSEPWPAFVYPGFKSIYDNGDSFSVKKAEVEIISVSADESKTISMSDFFPNVPKSQIQGFTRTHFSERNSIEAFSEEAIEWLRELATKFTDEDDFDINIKWKTEYYPKKDIVNGPDSVKVNAVYPILKNGVEDG